MRLYFNLPNRSFFVSRLGYGIGSDSLTSIVIFGGIQRIGLCSTFGASDGLTLFNQCNDPFFKRIKYYSLNIIEDAFRANAVLGGAVGAIILAGARRAAFSNEAGIGTAPMMHGATKTEEPIRDLWPCWALPLILFWYVL